MAIADAYEAMVSGRPYRNAITHGQAMAELRRHGGVQFDPELVGLFADLFGDGMPFPLDEHHGDHDHPHPHEPIDARSHAEIHDDLHARRRQVVRAAMPRESTLTGTEG